MSKSAARPNLAITPGEPAGIGPDLCLGLDPADYNSNLIIVADPDMLQRRAAQLDIPCALNVIKRAEQIRSDMINVWPVKLVETEVPGKLNNKNASYVLATLEQALDLCTRRLCGALVTAPINKAVINDAGIPFSGHTEWLAEHTHTARVVMMLASGNLRVALATTHLPLRQVADAINRTDLTTTIRIIHKDLQSKFGIAQPRIMVCGLNPHAGESGHLGMEEIEIINPTIAACRNEGINLTGPIPADTAFTPGGLEGIDAVLAMYHDQGLPVLKHHGFGEAVNITLGLPIIRTSVDHGTALDLAATGKAEIGSLRQAIATAEAMITAVNGQVS